MTRPDYSLIARQYPVEETLRKYGITVHNRTFHCPFHGRDANPSGSVYTGKDGIQRWKCHVCDVGGDSLDFVERYDGCDHLTARQRLMGSAEPTVRELPPPPPPKPALVLAPIPAELVARLRPGVKTPEIYHPGPDTRKVYWPTLVHPYLDADGHVTLLILRYQRHSGTKGFIPVRFEPGRGLISAGWQPGEARSFYREAELAIEGSRNVLVVEGEKVADLLATLDQFSRDYAVISWHGGTHAVAHHDWSKLRLRRITFWPDADRPKDGQTEGAGLLAMRKAAEACRPARIRIVEPLQAWIDHPTVKGFDAVDLIAELRDDATEARRVMETLAVEIRPPVQPPRKPPGGGGGGGGGNGPPGPPIGPGSPRYLTNADGGIGRSELLNIGIFIDEDRRFRHQLTFDVLDQAILIDREPFTGRRLYDLAVDIARISNFRGVTPNKVEEALNLLVRDDKLRHVNRVADQLQALTWDGTERHLLAYAGCDTTDRWVRVAGWRWLVGLVQRCLKPGWQHDGVLVIEGKQGTGKSTFFREIGQLFGENRHVELVKLTPDKDTLMAMRGKVVAELAEMTAHRQGDTDQLKTLISTIVDDYRDPYGRRVAANPRTCVFGGSTNEEQYLKDLTGNRRYWTVKQIRATDVAGLRRDREQLLAEAMHWIRLGQNAENHLVGDEIQLQIAAAESREIENPQFAELDTILDLQGANGTIEHGELWKQLMPAGSRKPYGHANYLEKAMAKRGWERGRFHRPESNRRSWRKLPGVDEVSPLS